MKKLLFSCLCFLLIVPVVIAQEASQSDVPDKADVMKFLELMHAREQMVRTLDGMAQQMRKGAEEGFKSKVPDATPEQLAKVDKFCDALFASLPVDKMVDAVVPIYQRHLTKSDLAAISAFYASPAGQKILKELPAIMTESMEAGGEIGRQAFSEKAQQIDQEIADLVKESQKQ